ncbi:MAG: O-antigen ligase family protein [Candidatus Deferrimicrobiaceae bacterium]
MYIFCTGVALYAWRDWYKSLCGLILLMAVLEHPDMPKAIWGIQGLNVWNLLCVCILLSWAFHRGEEGLSWDMPGHVTILLLTYLTVVLAGFFRLMLDQKFRAVVPAGEMVSEYLVNTVKWVIPGLLLFDGCRSRPRFLLALGSLLAVYFLLGIQVIRWIPPGVVASGQELSARSLKLLVKEIGYHRVNLSMMLSGASWAVLATVPLVGRGMYRILTIAAFLSLVYAQALTGGRMGYATWALLGVVLAFIRWKKILLMVPLVILAILTIVPSVGDRLAQGFSPSSRDQPGVALGFQSYNPGQPDLYTITAGRNIAWHFVVKKIAESPLVGFGRLAMRRTGLTEMLWKDYGEEFPHPHNAYLEMLLDNGWLGFLLVLPFYFVILWHAVSLFLDSRDPVFVSAGGVTCALVLALLVGSIGSQTFYPREGSVPMWCAIGLLLRVYVERSRGFSWPEKKREDPDEGMFWTREPTA